LRLYFSIFLLITGVYLLSTSGRMGLSDSIAMFNVAQRGVLVLKGGVPEQNPVASRLAFAREHNERDVVLSPEELDRLLGDVEVGV